MLFQYDNKVVISLPGVPYEMKAIMEDSVFPILPRYFSTPAILHRTILTTGIAESVLSKLLEEWEKSLPDSFSLAYLPSPGQVRLRISGSGSDREILEKEIQLLQERLISVVSDYHYGYEQDTLEEVTGSLLAKKGLTVATAESCTGGNISRLLTRIPGSSQYFRGSVVAYANDVKTKFLNVSDDLLSEQGAVSAAVVEQMAKSCRERFNVDFAVATSGIAGPGGGTETKPVGTVWIAVAGRIGVVSERYQFGEHRERNILKASLAALNLLRKVILKETRGS
jgi:nicotinamide-nucleotide amidase